MAISEDFRWPPVGRFPWPPSVADYAPAMGCPGIFAAARPVVRRDFVRPMSPWRSVVLGDEFV